MDGMRDQLIHEYDIVDLDEVWKAVDRDTRFVGKVRTVVAT